MNMNFFDELQAASLGFGQASAAIDEWLQRLRSRAIERDRVGGSLADDLRELAALGVTAARLPVELGVLGFSYPQAVDLLPGVGGA